MASAVHGIIGAFLLAGSPAQDIELCEQALRLAPGFSCAAAPQGVALSPNEAEARRLARLAELGESRFESAFGQRAVRYVVFDGRVSPELRNSLRSAGFIAQLPWLTREERNRTREESVRRRAAAQAALEGIPASQAGPFVEEAVARFRQGLSTEPDPDLALVPHELGHIWYVQAFWPDHAVGSGNEYGGPAPDWLDEISGLLMESEASTGRERDDFRQLYAAGRTGQIDNLADFLSRDHPMAGFSQAMMRRANPGRPGDAVAPGSQAMPDFQAITEFYAVSRVLADFLLETTNDRQIFRKIAIAIGAGRSFEQWLASDGAANGLAATIAGLDTQWRNWLGAHYRPNANPRP